MVEALCRLNGLMRSFACVSESDINRRKVLPAKVGRFAQSGADDAAADVCCARVVLSKLVSSEIASCACQVLIAKLLEVISDEGSLLEFFCRRCNLLRNLRESLEQSDCRIVE
jgi:hypothetical protein